MARTPPVSSERNSPSPPPDPSPRTKTKGKGKKGTKRRAQNKPSEASHPNKRQKEAISPSTSKRTVAPPPRPSIPVSGPSKAVPITRKRRSELPVSTNQLVTSSDEAPESESGDELSVLKDTFEDVDVTMANPKAHTPDPLDVVGTSQAIQPLPDHDSIDLQGSSRITGGFARGKAAGNTPNMADFPDIHQSSTSTIPLPSYVYFYFTPDNPAGFSITQVKPAFKASMPRHSTLEDIVQRLRLQYPGLDGMSYILLSLLLL